jgi:hypothetical protein
MRYLCTSASACYCMWNPGLTCPAISDLLHACLQTSYILAVNSGILSGTGGTCSDANCTVSTAGLLQASDLQICSAA